MKFLKKVHGSLSYVKKRKLLKQLIYLIEQEKVYTCPDYSLEFLENKTGADQKRINQVLLEKYKMSFYSLTRSLKIEFLKQLVKNTQDDTSLNDFIRSCGYQDSEAMLRDLKIETGLDFDEFCRYAQDINARESQSVDWKL